MQKKRRFLQTKRRYYGFTIIEIMVSFVVIAILGTISVVTYSSYTSGARDTNRIGQLVSIYEALELYQTKYIVPLPNDRLEIKDHGNIIAYQGFAGKTVLETIGYEGKGVDPKSESYFTYYITKNKKNIQLLGYLEKQYAFANTLAHDYKSKTPFVYGKKLGVMANRHNEPLHTDEHTISEGHFDFGHAHEDYISHFQNEGSLYAAANQMHIIADIVSSGEEVNSCLTWILSNPDLIGEYGYYYLNSQNQESYLGYCDWGGVVEEQVQGPAPFEQYLTGIVINGDFSSGTGVTGAEPSSEGNNKIISLASPIPSGYALYQKGSWSSEYVINLDPSVISQMLVGDVIRLSARVSDTSGYIFNNVLEYTDLTNDANGEMTVIDTQTVDGREWELQQVDHLVSKTPLSFQWRLGYNAESSPKKIYVTGINIEILRQ